MPANVDVASRNQKWTLTQNYRAMGLVSRLKAPAGGVEKMPRARGGDDAAEAREQRKRRAGGDSMGIEAVETRIIGETKVERDEEGRIVRVLREGNALNDSLARFDDDEDEGGKVQKEEEEEEDQEEDQEDKHRPAVIRELERLASVPTFKSVRHASETEVEWLRELVAKHGSDVGAMVRDRRLNRNQQTEADLGKRLKRAFGKGWTDEVK